MNKKASWMQELQFPSLTPKQLSSRALLVEEMDRMRDKAAQSGASTAVHHLQTGTLRRSLHSELLYRTCDPFPLLGEP